MPRAGPLRYWSLTLVALIISAGSAALFGWGLYHLLKTGSCASSDLYVSTRPCPEDTGLHIAAVVAAPFIAPLAVVAWALRGASNRSLLTRLRPRRRRLADRIARGETPMPTVARPSAAAQPVPSLTPLNRTDPPATWEPQAAPAARARPTAGESDAPAVEGEASPVERLNELSRMKDDGLITVAEFEAQKKHIFGGI